MPEPRTQTDTYGKLLLRRRSPYTAVSVGVIALASIVLPYFAANAVTSSDWLLVIVAGSPLPLFFGYSVAIRLEIFESVIRVRKLWGTRVIPLSQLQSFYLRGSQRRLSSLAGVRLIFRPREGSNVHVTVEGYADDDELHTVLDGVAKHAPSLSE